MLSIVTLIIVTYQYFEYLKTIETFTIQEINGNIIIEPKTKIKIGKKNTENDAVINSLEFFVLMRLELEIKYLMKISLNV